MTCVGCNGPIADALARVSSLRCHDCRDLSSLPRTATHHQRFRLIPVESPSLVAVHESAGSSPSAGTNTKRPGPHERVPAFDYFRLALALTGRTLP